MNPQAPLRTFFGNLRKKRIVEILAGFIAGGWLIIEFVDRILVAHYHFPDKTIDIVFITLLCALICTLLWRWFSGREVPRKFKLELVLIPLAVLITVLLDANLLLHLKEPESGGIPPSKWKNSVAVLPFKDISPQKDQDWFCDGVTGEIISRLSNIRELKVAARASAFFFKGQDQDIREIGHKLGVATVLEGSIQKVEGRLRITVDLVNIADGANVWSQQFDQDIKDVFAIQDDIALSVVGKLKVTLLGEEKARIARRSEINPAAYEAYLRGLNYWWQWSDDGMRNAVQYFKRAIEIEPDYAPAHAGLAIAYMASSTWILLWPSQEGIVRGRKEAQEAIRIDPTLSDGYVAIAQALMNYDWDWVGAEEGYKKALELNPNSTLALDSYANLLAVRGRVDQAAVMLNRALELDPFSAALHNDMGLIYWENRQFERSIPHFQRALEIDRNFDFSHHLLGWAYLYTGKRAKAEAEFQTLAQLAPNLAWVQGARGLFWGSIGHPEEARKALARLDVLAGLRYVSPSARAYAYWGAGEKGLSLDWFENAYQEHDGWIWDLYINPYNDSIRDEPRFKALSKKVEFGK